MRISTLPNGRKLNTFVKTHIACISTSLTQYRKSRWVPYGFPKSKESFQRNLKITKSRLEMFTAQKKRQPWDYPLADDQRASWKHTRWYDQFYKKWVDTKPVLQRKSLNINIKEKRAIIHDQETLVNKFHVLLDCDRRRKYIINPCNMSFPRNSSYFYQHLTNTKFVHGLPYCIDSMPVSSGMLEKFENHITNFLQLELVHNKNTAADKNRKTRADRILTMIVHHLLALASHEDFQDCEVDHNPENSMYWLRGRGFHKWSMPDDLPILFQSHDTPMYQIRMKERLPEFTPWMDDFMLHTELPHCEFTPHVYGIKRKTYRNTITPGIRYQAGDIEMNYDEAFEQNKLKDLPPPVPFQRLFGHTQFISLPQEFDQKWYKANPHHCDITDQIEEHIKAHGIMSGWTWAAAQAHYIGHWMDNDIEEPISIQTIITDGEYMSFFCYQLNTVAIDPDNANENPRRNVCYGTPMMRLFNRVQGTDDIELYRDTLNLLLKFAMNNSKAEVDRKKVIAHNSTLKVQEWDHENPVIELQKPKHIREQEQLRQEEEEKEKKMLESQKTMKDKFLSIIGRK